MVIKMKKFVLPLFIICSFLIPVQIANANSIAEPENSFYKRHERDVKYLGRTFVANGENGNVNVRKAPNTRTKKGSILNGETVYVEASCLYDGEFWGFAPYNYNGWIKLEQVLVLYDYVSFEEEHLKELYRYNGDYSEIKKSRSALVWAFPGAEAPSYTLEHLNMDSFTVDYAYTDENEREWGFVTFTYGSRNFWVCLSEPLNRNLPALNPAPPPLPWVSETEHTDISKYSDYTFVVIVVLVAVLVSGTVILIKVFYKGERHGHKNEKTLS